jgi:thioredoxin-like negative regulator of GroEL
MQFNSSRQRVHALVVVLGLFALPLVNAGCEAAKKTYNYFKGNTPIKYAELMEDDRSPDNRRLGIATLSKEPFGQKDPYLTRYRQIAAMDADPLVRATAIRALNVSRDTESADLYLKALADEESIIRLEGAKALGNMPNPAATEALLKLLNNTAEDADIRIAAAKALKYYKQRDVARALAGVLGDDRNFGLAWEARRSLKEITGVDYAYDDAAWLEYISNPAQPLS